MSDSHRHDPALRADREIEFLLDSARAIRLPDRARFVDQVMERVESAGQPAPLPDVWPAAPPLPWWIQAASDPAAVLACVLIALFIWRPDALSALPRFVSERWGVLLAPALSGARALLGLDRPLVALGLAIVGLLALGWLSLQLYRWTERFTRRSAGA